MRGGPAALLALALLPTAGCPGRSRPAATPDAPSILVVAVDTLRADRLGCYGSARGLTPRLDALAAEGARFENAFAHAPWTLPSFASFFSSLSPEEHGAGGRVNDYRALRDSAETFPERFRDAGCETAAIVNVDFLARPFGVTQGFDHVDARAYPDNERVRDARETTDAALAWLGGRAPGRFLLLVHYFDPHAEYRPPVEFRRRFAAAQDREDPSFRFGTRQQVVLRRTGRLALEPSDVERAERLYDGEVAHVDQEVGRLLDGLARQGLERTTLVVLTSDHGEEFQDHGDWEHGHTLYDELLRVPLILRQPGRIAPIVVAQPVGHVDVAPTLCALGRVPAAASFTGRDLSPALSGSVLAERALLASGSFWGPPLVALRDRTRKLIARPDGPPRLFAWTADAREERDLSGAEPGELQRLTAELQRLEAAARERHPLPGPSVRLTVEQTRRLQEVGYAGDSGEGKD